MRNLPLIPDLPPKSLLLLTIRVIRWNNRTVARQLYADALPGENDAVLVKIELPASAVVPRGNTPGFGFSHNKR